MFRYSFPKTYHACGKKATDLPPGFWGCKGIVDIDCTLPGIPFLLNMTYIPVLTWYNILNPTSDNHTQFKLRNMEAINQHQTQDTNSFPADRIAMVAGGLLLLGNGIRHGSLLRSLIGGYLAYRGIAGERSFGEM